MECRSIALLTIARRASELKDLEYVPIKTRLANFEFSTIQKQPRLYIISDALIPHTTVVVVVSENRKLKADSSCREVIMGD